MSQHDDTPFIRLGRKLHQLQEANEPFRMGIGFDPDDERVMISMEWGREAEDSPMIGAASYGVGATLAEAFETVIDEIKAPEAGDPWQRVSELEAEIATRNTVDHAQRGEFRPEPPTEHFDGIGEVPVQREGNNETSAIVNRQTLESILGTVAPQVEMRVRSILAQTAKASITLRVGSGPYDVTEADFVAIDQALTESTGD